MLGFVTSGGQDFNPGTETRLDQIINSRIILYNNTFLNILLKSRLCEKSIRSEVGVCKKKAIEIEGFSSGQTSSSPHYKAGQIK